MKALDTTKANEYVWVGRWYVQPLSNSSRMWFLVGKNETYSDEILFLEPHGI